MRRFSARANSIHGDENSVAPIYFAACAPLRGKLDLRLIDSRRRHGGGLACGRGEEIEVRLDRL